MHGVDRRLSRRDRQRPERPDRAGAGGHASKPSIGSRMTAGGSLVAFVATLVLIGFTVRELAYVLVSLIAVALAISALWIAATNRRFRWISAAAALACVGGSVTALVAAGRGIVAIVIVVLAMLVTSALGSIALRWEVNHALAERWRDVPATRHGVVLMNPKSGGGKVEVWDLAGEARRRGVEPILLKPGDDLRALAEAAVTKGADALAMAGGDGSQAIVASVASRHGLPFICVPAGTRNHFALDIGIDRNDPVRALDAFGPARETIIDLGEVNGESFVNNVSLGIYARIVASDQYRRAKRRTVAEMLPDLLGPSAPPFGLSIDAPDRPITDARLIQVSNNPYTLSSLSGFGSRARLNMGALGVASLSITRTSDVDRLVALETAGHPERYEGWRSWTARHLEVEGPSPLAAAIDGEAREWTPPLRFRIRPLALRVRIARGQSGASPAFGRAPLAVSTLAGLWRVVCGKPSGIVPVGEGT